MSHPQAVTRAIIEGRRPGKTSVWLILGLVGAGLCLLLAVIYLLLATVFVGVLLFFFALPSTVLFLGLVLYVDRFEPEPKLLLLFCLLWGMGTSIVFALILNTLAGTLLFVPHFGMAVGGQLTASISAPIVEEGLKGLAILFLFVRRRHEMNGFTDAVVYSACVGLGFALMENVQYYFVGLISGGLQMGGFDFVGALSGLGLTIAVRGILSPLCHPMFTLMTALGFLYAANRRGSARVLVVAAGWFGAMLLHALWNTGSVIGHLFGLPDAFLLSQLPVYVLFMGLLAAIVYLLVKDRRRVVRLINQFLPQYAGTGAVTESDVRMLGTLRGRKQAREYIASRYGPPARRAMGDYQQVATELALLHERADKGGVTPQQFQQRQSDLVAALKVTYNAAMGGPGVVPAPWQRHGPPPPQAFPPHGPPQAFPPQGPPHGPPHGPPRALPPQGPSQGPPRALPPHGQPQGQPRALPPQGPPQPYFPPQGPPPQAPPPHGPPPGPPGRR